MKVYDLLYQAPAPAGIEDRRAYIVGGGIAGLTAAALLVTDAHMPAENVTIIEASPVVGGSMDGTGSAIDGYFCRGERELEPFMETLWYLCSKVPSLRHAGRTVLDDVHDFNREVPIFAKARVIEKQGQPVDYHDFTLDPELLRLMSDLVYMPEDRLEGVSIEQYFPERFFDTNLWWTFHPMLAFKPYHSAIECKRYFRRFTHFAPQSDYLVGILHTDLNEYDAIILPITTWLESLGVQFQTSTAVTEITMTDDNNTVRGLELRHDGSTRHIEVRPQDLVFFSNGSMTTNSAWGTKDTVAATRRETDRRGVFTLWEQLAARDPKFGNPAAFISDVDATKWASFFPTITDFPQFREAVERISQVPWGTGGIITIKDSAWDLSLIPHHTPFFPDQPANVDVFWAYGLFGERIGDYVKKPMGECTGAEMLTELLYHLGLLHLADEMLEHCAISTAMMPYITSQFMPRQISDRPLVIPPGCTNLAFIGQFVETPEDAVFTVETSCRTALHAVYTLTGLDKPQLEVAPTFYDMRYVLAMMKKFQGADGELTPRDLPKVKPWRLRAARTDAVESINRIEPMPSLYPGRVNPLA